MSTHLRAQSAEAGNAAKAAPLKLDRTLTYRLHLLHKLTDQESQRAYPEATGLSMSEGRCLTTVGSFEPLSVNDLARLANLNKGQASRAAQALVNQGLVSKEDHPGDGRGVVLALTAAGRRIWRKAMRMVEQRNVEIFSCLSITERAQLSKYLDRLVTHNRGGSGVESNDVL
ncbi:MAG: MarR family transcriptional regulator [Pseudomonadota bacterium]